MTPRRPDAEEREPAGEAVGGMREKVEFAMNPAIRGSDRSAVVVEKPDGSREFLPVNALRDSVAAHQAECRCHPITCDGMGEIDCCDRRKSGTPPDARDMRGDQWHLDPLCKVRPEARA